MHGVVTFDEGEFGDRIFSGKVSYWVVWCEGDGFLWD